MSRKFDYQPRFLDIRVKKPGSAEKPAARPKSSAKTKPEATEKTCEHKGCDLPAPCRAPKSRELNEYYWFCASHAAEYNRSWNFFQGMDDQDFKSFSESARTGHRPTWSMQADSHSREAQTARQKATVDAAKVDDPFDLFRGPCRIIDPVLPFDPRPRRRQRRRSAPGFAFNRRVMVQGYHGTGKSTHIEQVAARLNWPLVRVNLDSHVSASTSSARTPSS
jgi:hypothetical protein